MDLHRWAGRALCCAALLFSASALAEAPPPRADADERGAAAPPPRGDDAPPVQLDPVEVIGTRPPEDRLPSPADEPTGFGTTLRQRAHLGERLAARDLLLHAPGATVRQLPGGSTLALRGATPDQTLVFLDGIRLSSAAGGGVDLQNLPLSLLDELTVLRGNEGARFGAGALGGVALLRTPRARERLQLRLSGGSFGTYALDAAASDRGPRFHGLAALSLERTEGDYPAAFDPTPSSAGAVREERVENNDARGGALLLKGGAYLGELHLEALALGSLAERGLPGTLYLRDTQRRADRRFLAALSAAPRTPGDLDARLGLSYRREAHSVWGAERPSVISQPSAPGGERAWQIEEALEARATLDWAPAAFTLLGLDASVGEERIDSPYHGDPSRQLLSVGAFDELYLGDDLLLVVAGRLDRIGDHAGFSPKLGASYRPLDWLELRANAAQSFRAPSLSELYLVFGPVQPNPDLRPERGRMVDGGFILHGARATAQLSAFYGRTEDLISYEIVSGGRSKPFNFLEAETHGAEADVSLRPLPWLTVRGGWGMARTRNLLDDPRYLGKELPYRPAHRLFGRISAHPDGWEGFAEAHHQTTQWVNRSNTASLPAQPWFRVGAGRRLTTLPWETWLSAQAENLFDAYLVDQLGFPRAGRAFFLTLRASSPTN